MLRVIAFVLACLAPLALHAQTFDFPLAGNIDTGAIQTLTSQGAGTLNSADQVNFGNSSITCTYNQSASTGTPSTTFSIQYKDTASGQYVSLITSAAITANNTPTAISVGAGAATANVSDTRKLPRTWRTQVVVAGTTPVVTATVGCSVSR